jgi:hypothetical protein
MVILIGGLIIVVGAFAVAAIHAYVHSVPLTIVLNIDPFCRCGRHIHLATLKVTQTLHFQG